MFVSDHPGSEVASYVSTPVSVELKAFCSTVTGCFSSSEPVTVEVDYVMCFTFFVVKGMAKSFSYMSESRSRVILNSLKSAFSIFW